LFAKNELLSPDIFNFSDKFGIDEKSSKPEIQPIRKSAFLG
jgi:hypothetical protein